MAIVINSQWDAQQFYKQKEEARRHINSQWDAQQFYETYGGNGHSGNWGSHEWLQKEVQHTTPITQLSVHGRSLQCPTLALLALQQKPLLKV